MNRTIFRLFGRGLLCLLFFAVSIGATAQNVTIKAKGATLKSVLQQITSQTGFKFAYSDAISANSRMVDVDAENQDLFQFCKSFFGANGIDYKIDGELISLSVVRPQQQVKPTSGRQRITGKVTDEDGYPLVGVAVVVKGDVSDYSITDNSGNYSIVVEKMQGIVLEFSFLGMDTQDVDVQKSSVVNVVMSKNQVNLEEAVVVGYGSVARRDLTGSIASVKSTEIRNIHAMSVDDVLAGKAAGVSAIKADGTPGGAIRMRIRGGTSLVGGSDPLYVIDGIPIEVTNNYISTTEVVNPIEAQNYGDSFNSSISGSFMRGLNNIAGLNINDIETIDILKDASATAIYGSKAANGVVIITTKRGQNDMKPQLSVSAYAGVQLPIHQLLLNGTQYKEAIGDAAQRAIDNYNTNLASFTNPAQAMFYKAFAGSYKKQAESTLASLDKLGDANTDWLGLVLRTGVTKNIDASIKGGGQTSRYYTSMSYSKQDGTVINTDFERYAGKINLDYDLAKWAHVTTNVNLGYTKNNITDGAYSQALLASPLAKPYNDDGSYNMEIFYGSSSSYMGYQNPLALATAKNQAKTYLMQGTLGLTIDITKDLIFKSSASLDFSSYNQVNYVPSYLKIGGFYGAEDSGRGTGSQANSTSINKFFENTLTYDKSFNKIHKLNVLVGTSWEDRKYNYFSASGSGYPDDFVLNNLSSASQVGTVSGANPASQSCLLSFYARLNYVLLDRYLFTFTGRSDSSSKFGPENRTGFFPSGAIAWRLSEEPFMKGISWIDEIKIRASAGKTGTQNIGNDMYRTLYSPGSYAGATAMYPTQLGNSAIHWESTIQKDLGVDFSFFNFRLGGSFGYYDKETDGALLNVTPAPSSGFTTVIYNIADISNKGLELELHGDYIRSRDWTWSGSLNIARNKSKVLNIQGNDFSDPTNRNNLNLGTSIVREGEELGLLYGRVVKGIITSQEQLDAYHAGFKSTGKYSFWEVFEPLGGIGNPEYELDPDTHLYKQDVIGHASPDFFGGYTNTLRYKNLSLIASFIFSYGNDLIYQYDVSDVSMSTYSNRSVRVLEGYSSTNTSSSRPSSVWGQINMLTNLNVYDASYIKLKNLTLNYNLPRKWLQEINLTNAAIYATASNVFTITKYPGPDPEVSDDPTSVIGGGRDISSYPTSKGYIFGVRVSF
jgi:TonB-linked SusC/RagA family outer membrane protein